MKLLNARLNRLSEIFSGTAQVVLASIILPYAIDKANPNLLALGVVAFILCVAASIYLARP